MALADHLRASVATGRPGQTGHPAQPIWPDPGPGPWLLDGDEVRSVFLETLRSSSLPAALRALPLERATCHATRQGVLHLCRGPALARLWRAGSRRLIRGVNPQRAVVVQGRYEIGPDEIFVECYREEARYASREAYEAKELPVIRRSVLRTQDGALVLRTLERHLQDGVERIHRTTIRTKDEDRTEEVETYHCEDGQARLVLVRRASSSFEYAYPWLETEAYDRARADLLAWPDEGDAWLNGQRSLSRKRARQC